MLIYDDVVRKLSAVRTLNIDVPDQLAACWREYLAPRWQPFFVDPDSAWTTPSDVGSPTLTPDLRDTFKAWRVQGDRRVVWFDERSFMVLPRADRAQLVRAQAECRRGTVPTVRRWAGRFDGAVLRGQADGHRFVWWPSLLAQDPGPVLVDHVEDGQLPSRHAEVSARTWKAAGAVLPGARELAGTFPDGSGANCFGSVMAAAGMAGPAEWLLTERFEAWLATACVRGGRDEDPGTVLVWRDRDGSPVHAAVTLGDGWALEKPAQTWWTPRGVHEVRNLIKANRAAGQRMERHHIGLIGY